MFGGNLAQTSRQFLRSDVSIDGAGRYPLAEQHLQGREITHLDCQQSHAGAGRNPLERPRRQVETVMTPAPSASVIERCAQPAPKLAAVAFPIHPYS